MHFIEAASDCEVVWPTIHSAETNRARISSLQPFRLFHIMLAFFLSIIGITLAPGNYASIIGEHSIGL